MRLRSLVERVVEEGIAQGAFVAGDHERAIAYIFDASFRFTHPLAIQQDADVPRDLMEARLDTVIWAIQKVLRTGTAVVAEVACLHRSCQVHPPGLA